METTNKYTKEHDILFTRLPVNGYMLFYPKLEKQDLFPSPVLLQKVEDNGYKYCSIGDISYLDEEVRLFNWTFNQALEKSWTWYIPTETEVTLMIISKGKWYPENGNKATG